MPGTVRFCDAAVGDVTGDGYPDLYFSDYDLTENGFPEAPGTDLNDRLLVNDGHGFFTDETAARMTSAMTLCAFGTSCDIADLNLDGRNDIVRVSTLFTPPTISITIAYNDANPTSQPNGVGMFDLYQGTVYAAAPYHVYIGDLNNDARPDIMNSDDGTDGWRLNTGVDALGRVTWSAIGTVTWLDGSGEDGFTAAHRIVDLDDDGWNDVIICDFDVDVLGCNRRTKHLPQPGRRAGHDVDHAARGEAATRRGRLVRRQGALARRPEGQLRRGRVRHRQRRRHRHRHGPLHRHVRVDQPAARGARATRRTASATVRARACPCGNDSAAGDEEGCLNSLGTGGRLHPGGSARVTADTLVLQGSRMPNGSALYYQGTLEVNGGLGAVFGDGLRCAGGTVHPPRHGARTSRVRRNTRPAETCRCPCTARSWRATRATTSAGTATRRASAISRRST